MKSIDILRSFKDFAVVGATVDESKYGYKIVERLKELNKTVYPISPKYDKVDELRAYKSISEVNKPIDVVVFVVNKKFASSYLAEMCEYGIGYAWMQPGTYDEELLEEIRQRGLTPIEDCVLIRSEEL